MTLDDFPPAPPAYCESLDDKKLDDVFQRRSEPPATDWPAQVRHGDTSRHQMLTLHHNVEAEWHPLREPDEGDRWFRDRRCVEHDELAVAIGAVRDPDDPAFVVRGASRRRDEWRF